MAKDNLKGLTAEQVEESRRKYGSNILTPPEKTSLWKQFLEKFEDPIIRILLLAWVLSMIISSVHCWGPEQEGFAAFLEPLGIFFAIMLASTIGFFFEVKAARAFEVLNAVNDDIMVTVIRDGKVQEVSRKEIVVGDVVMLNTGDEAPADGVLLESHSLQINESTLTGEPVISKTTVEADFDNEATYPSNKVLRSTTVVDGHGIMCVELVGDATEYGKVNQGALIDNNLETPLQLQLKRLAGVISKMGYTVAAITFLMLTAKVFLASEPMGTMDIVSALLHNFMIAVTLIVVSVPEGLPMSVTLSLALSMNRMLKTNNLVRKMHACETMGATTVICTDKTGTLTENKMTVRQQFLTSQENGVLIAGLCNGVRYEDDEWIGNPTDLASYYFALDNDFEKLKADRNFEKEYEIPFDSNRKLMTTVNQKDGKLIAYTKGAPDIVVARCNRILIDGKIVELTNELKQQNKTLIDYLNDIYQKTTYLFDIGDSVKFQGVDSKQKMADVIANWRNNPPAQIGEYKIEKIVDYLNDNTGVPKQNFLEYYAGGGLKFILRPSGTEPKLKIYLFLKGQDKQTTKQKALEVMEQIKSMLK